MEIENIVVDVTEQKYWCNTVMLEKRMKLESPKRRAKCELKEEGGGGGPRRNKVILCVK